MLNLRSMETKIKAYGRTELALLYSPHLAPSSAWRKLKLWLLTHPRLRTMARQRTRTFTPAQVRRIFDLLGEP